MKTFIKIILAITISIFSISESTAQVFGDRKVKGNGNVVTKTINTKEYDIIKIVGSMDVTLQKGTEGNITLTTDENLHEYLTIESDNDILKIKVEKNISLRTKKGIHIIVPFNDISEITLVGSGDVISENKINSSDDFSVTLTGSGDIVLTIDSPYLDTQVVGSGDVILNVNSNNIDAKVVGSGDLKLTGNTKELEVKVSGSGDFMGSSLSSENTQTYVSGSGTAKVNATNSLKARINGSGDIRYSGNPNTNDTKVIGSGSIKSM